MNAPDLYHPCPRCRRDCPAWYGPRDYRRDVTVIRVWCEAHGTKQVTT